MIATEGNGTRLGPVPRHLGRSSRCGPFPTRGEGCVQRWGFVHCLGQTATHFGRGSVPTVRKAESHRDTGRLSTTSWKPDAIMVEEGKPMFWQFLAQRLLRLRRFRTRTVPPVKTTTHEPSCDRALAEVHVAHAAIHGPYKLLPQHTLPSPPSGHELETKAAPE